MTVQITSIDNDTLQAVRAAWLADGTLPGLSDRAPASGAVRSPSDQPLALPYAQIVCEQGEDGARYPDGTLKDRRRVVLRIWGLKLDVVRHIARARQLYGRMWRASTPTLTYPSGATLTSVVVAREALLPDGTFREGQEVWRGELELRVTSSRRDGGIT